MATAAGTESKTKGGARAAEAKRAEERRRGVSVLVYNWLVGSGYQSAAERLQAECPVKDLASYEAADNLDLVMMLQDYEEYFQMRFEKRPTLYRRRTDTPAQPGRQRQQRRAASQSGSPRGPHKTGGGGIHLPKVKGASQEPGGPAVSPPMSGGRSPAAAVAAAAVVPEQMGTTALDLGLVGRPAPIVCGPAQKPQRLLPVAARSEPPSSGDEGDEEGEEEEEGEDGERKPKLPVIPEKLFPTAELRELAETINRDVVVTDPQVRWDDIVGLDLPKRLVKEAVVMPIKYPDLFKGILSPWKGVLLFGPPGTGKTLIAKAVATEVKTTFFNISASSIASKWRGDSEKLIRVLFDLARSYAPSTIFLDEIDALMGNRGDDSFEHEASRRTKTEMLVQMDGLVKSDALVFVLAASNLPWTLDAAFLRRLEKRIYVPLPDESARVDMFKRLLTQEMGPGLPYEVLAQKTSGYSGSDIRIICKEAAMCPLRRLLVTLECAKGGPDGQEEPAPKVGAVTMEDVDSAISNTKAASQDSGRYERWRHEFGSS